MTSETMVDTVHPWAASFAFMCMGLVAGIPTGVLAGSVEMAIGVWLVLTLVLIAFHLTLTHQDKRGLIYLVRTWSTSTAEPSTKLCVFKGAFLDEED